jgi:dTDP-glucose 4,6-dehydratase
MIRESTILVTGGSGFIGSALIRYLIKNTKNNIINIDKLTYAGNKESLESIENSSRYFFEEVDICNKDQIDRVFNTYKPNIIMHLAAESHVDNSILDPSIFIKTNIIGTYNLLEASREYIKKIDIQSQESFRFHHVLQMKSLEI